MKNYVSNEIGILRKILIHSPDGGIGKIVPKKFKEWLYDDTVHLSKMREEYDEYILLLLYFMDPEKANYINQFEAAENTNQKRTVFMPDKAAYFNSDKVLDVQKILSDILEDKLIKIRLVAAICAIESCSQDIQNKLEKLKAVELSKTLLTGVLKLKKAEKYIFPPIPNLIFTRDITIMIKDHILLSKSATQVRQRESIIAKYISLFHKQLFAKTPKKVLEISSGSNFFLEDIESQQEKIISIEGGDVMMIADNHLIIGCSERTTSSAANAILHKIWRIPSLAIEKISVITIPATRAQMHIDTIFTQIKKNAWIVYGEYSQERKQARKSTPKNYASLLLGEQTSSKVNKLQIVQFYKNKEESFLPSKNYFSKQLKGLEELLHQISVEDFGVPKSKVKIIYSGQDQFPYNEREQWTDSCNVLALKNGVVIGYDRNEKTIEAFKDPVHGLGFKVIKAKKLLRSLQKGKDIHQLKDTLILLSSAELSRARGGPHCMSMPLNRDKI